MAIESEGRKHRPRLKNTAREVRLLTCRAGSTCDSGTGFVDPATGMEFGVSPGWTRTMWINVHHEANDVPGPSPAPPLLSSPGGENAGSDSQDSGTGVGIQAICVSPHQGISPSTAVEPDLGTRAQARRAISEMEGSLPPWAEAMRFQLDALQVAIEKSCRKTEDDALSDSAHELGFLAPPWAESMASQLRLLQAVVADMQEQLGDSSHSHGSRLAAQQVTRPSKPKMTFHRRLWRPR